MVAQLHLDGSGSAVFYHVPRLRWFSEGLPTRPWQCMQAQGDERTIILPATSTAPAESFVVTVVDGQIQLVAPWGRITKNGEPPRR